MLAKYFRSMVFPENAGTMGVGKWMTKVHGSIEIILCVERFFEFYVVILSDKDEKYQILRMVPRFWSLQTVSVNNLNPNFYSLEETPL